MDTKKLIENTFGAVLVLTIITFVIVFIAYGCTGVNDRLKETLTITIGFFGGLATLGAAYIASRLFNDWRDQHNKTVEKEMAWIVIQKFDAAEFNLSRFRDGFQNFKYKCNFLSEMSDEEFQNLDNELNSILSSLRGVSLDFSLFLESVRKYSLVAEKTYFQDITNDIQQINSIIFNTQNHRAHFPNSMNAIEGAIKALLKHVKNIEEICVDNTLTELKALT